MSLSINKTLKLFTFSPLIFLQSRVELAIAAFNRFISIQPQHFGKIDSILCFLYLYISFLDFSSFGALPSSWESELSNLDGHLYFQTSCRHNLKFKKKISLFENVILHCVFSSLECYITISKTRSSYLFLRTDNP